MESVPDSSDDTDISMVLPVARLPRRYRRKRVAVTMTEHNKWSGPTADVEQCLADVRWRGATLQQLWLITTITDGNGTYGLEVESRTEWRDVPNCGADGEEQSR